MLRYDGAELVLARVGSAWYRRPTLFAPEQSDKSLQLSLDNERRMVQYSLWENVPARAWLSRPTSILHAEHKLTQLVAAKRIGFKIPYTVVTNDWAVLQSQLRNDVIYKPSYGMLYQDNALRMVYTTRFEEHALLPKDGNPFPGFWQSYLPKAREWRITIVGDQSFDAAIYTDSDAKDDWRRHQLGTGVRFRAETFPVVEKQMCFTT